VKRRTFIAGLGAATAWPLAPRAQQTLMRRIGALIVLDEGDPDRKQWIAEFSAALSKLGWVDGHTVRIDWRWAAANEERARASAQELVALKPDVIFVDGTLVALAAESATRSVPIVFAHVTDPVTSGFVSSLARPAGNMTGFTDTEPESRGKLVEFVKQMAPDTARVVTIWGAGISQTLTVRKVTDTITHAASTLGLSGTVVEVKDAREIEDAVVTFARDPDGAIILPGDPVTTTHHALILDLAAAYRLPVVGGYRPLAREGALASFGANINEQYRGAATYIDRILRGEKPAALPVQQPVKYELRINLRTAKALGLIVPTALLTFAKEVIE
jgi:putative ABC transport system substrate-binding protein